MSFVPSKSFTYGRTWDNDVGIDVGVGVDVDDDVIDDLDGDCMRSLCANSRTNTDTLVENRFFISANQKSKKSFNGSARSKSSHSVNDSSKCSAKTNFGWQSDREYESEYEYKSDCDEELQGIGIGEVDREVASLCTGMCIKFGNQRHREFVAKHESDEDSIGLNLNQHVQQVKSHLDTCENVNGYKRNPRYRPSNPIARSLEVQSVTSVDCLYWDCVQVHANVEFNEDELETTYMPISPHRGASSNNKSMGEDLSTQWISSCGHSNRKARSRYNSYISPDSSSNVMSNQSSEASNGSCKRVKYNCK